MSNQAASIQSKQEILTSTEKWLERALGLVSVGFILLFLYTALRRMGYPFSFDQIEGGIITSVWRIAHGLPLYVKPTPEFVPYLYAPGYFYVAAALSKAIGVGYASLRLVSIFGTLGSLGVTFALIHGETRSRLASLAGSGLFAACYHPLEGWFDLGRVDSLFVFLFLLAIYCTRRAPILLAVFVWLIAFQVKQTILPVSLLVLCADWQRPRRLIIGLIALLAGLGGSILVMNRLTDGWYSYYLLGSSQALPWIFRAAVFYIPMDLLQPLGLAFLIILASILCAPPAFRGRSTQFYLFVSFAIYASIWYLRAHWGSAVNTLMPAYAWSAVLFGVCFHRLWLWLGSRQSSHAQLCRVLVLGAAVVQIIGFIYHPGRFVPSAATREARQKFERQLSAIPGDIYVINHSYDAILAGKKPHAVIDAFGAILASPPSAIRSAFIADLRRAFDTHIYGGIVLDDTVDTYNNDAGWLPADFLDQYPIRLLAFSWSNTAGQANQPEERWIYLPCSVLDGDTSNLITPTSVVSFGNCPNAPALKPK